MTTTLPKSAKRKRQSTTPDPATEPRPAATSDTGRDAPPGTKRSERGQARRRSGAASATEAAASPGTRRRERSGTQPEATSRTKRGEPRTRSAAAPAAEAAASPGTKRGERSGGTAGARSGAARDGKAGAASGGKSAVRSGAARDAEAGAASGGKSGVRSGAASGAETVGKAGTRTRPGTKPGAKPGTRPGGKPAGRPAGKPVVRTERDTRTARPAARAPRTPFVLLIVGLLGGALISLLLLNTVLAEDAFRLNDLQRQNTLMLQHEQALKVDVKKAESPTELARRARELGMRPGPLTPRFADAQHPANGTAARVAGDHAKRRHANAKPRNGNTARTNKPERRHKRNRSTPAPSASGDAAIAGSGR